MEISHTIQKLPELRPAFLHGNKELALRRRWPHPRCAVVPESGQRMQQVHLPQACFTAISASPVGKRVGHQDPGPRPTPLTYRWDTDPQMEQRPAKGLLSGRPGSPPVLGTTAQIRAGAFPVPCPCKHQITSRGRIHFQEEELGSPLRILGRRKRIMASMGGGS